MFGCQAIGIGKTVGYGYLDNGRNHPDPTPNGWSINGDVMKMVNVIVWNAENGVKVRLYR
jgi:hypothetical protein